MLEVAVPVSSSQPTDSTWMPVIPLATGQPSGREAADCTAAEPVHVQPCGQVPMASVSKRRRGKCRASCEAVELAGAASVAVGRPGTCRVPGAVAVSPALKEEVACHAAVPAAVREHGRCALRERERGGAARHAVPCAVRVQAVHVHVARAAAARDGRVGRGRSWRRRGR
eukprot:scaffold63598_cov54-Phaeocystis_antarctica.AAC.1